MSDTFGDAIARTKGSKYKHRALQDETVKCGSIAKYGRRHVSSNKWQARWFKLAGDFLHYYKDNSEKQMKGSINLANLRIPVQRSGKTFELSLCVPGNKDLSVLLHKATQEDADEWVKLIEIQAGNTIISADLTAQALQHIDHCWSQMQGWRKAQAGMISTMTRGKMWDGA